jgi:transposase
MLSFRGSLHVLRFVLTTGCRWEDLPREFGCFGRTAHRRLRAWQELSLWRRLHQRMLESLRKAHLLERDVVVIDGAIVRAFGAGEHARPNPMDRRKAGTKYTLMVDSNGIPLEIHTAPDNVSDQKQIVPIVEDFPRVAGVPGSPKRLPGKSYADRGYDCRANRAALAMFGIEALIAKRKTPHSCGMGKTRSVVERTNSWLMRLRRMRICYDRLETNHDTRTSLVDAVLCFNIAYDIYRS